MPGLGGPCEEGADDGSLSAGRIDGPGIEVGLGESGQAVTGVPGPGEELVCLADLVAVVGVPAGVQRAGGGGVLEAPLQYPAVVMAHCLAVLFVGDAGDVVGGPGGGAVQG